MSEQQFPPGWNETRVKGLLAHYEGQSEDEQADEIEDALASDAVTMVAVPTGLVPEVRALISRYQPAPAESFGT